MRVGIALNPATPLSVLDCVLEQADMILLMSVNPGFGGQKLIPYILEKISRLRKRLNQLGLETDIEVDGGVTLENVGQLLGAGANVIVAGSAVYRGDTSANVRAFINTFEELSE